MLDITLYTREGCGLCDEVKEELTLLVHRFPHRLYEVDIDQDPELMEKYGRIIPVLRIGDVVMQAPIAPAALRIALERATNSRTRGLRRKP